MNPVILHMGAYSPEPQIGYLHPLKWRGLLMSLSGWWMENSDVIAMNEISKYGYITLH